MFWAVEVYSNCCIERNTPYKSCIERDEEIWSQNNFGYTHICLWLRALSGPELGYIQVLRTTVRGNCQSYEKIVKSYSCPHWVQLLFIIGYGPGGSGLWNGDRDKHWVQLLFNSSLSTFSFNSTFCHRLPIGKNCKLCPPWNCKILQLSTLKL